MKKITVLLLLVQCGFLMAQTETVPTINGKKVQINPFVDNGLTATNGHIQLGGSLIQPTTITASLTNTLAIKDLLAGLPTDNIITADPTTGVLRTISGSKFAWNLTGNAGINPTNNFLGTTDAQPIKFRINNTYAGMISQYTLALGLNSCASTFGSHIAIGTNALSKYNANNSNIAIGSNTLSKLTGGTGNIAIGDAAMQNVANVGNNIAIGNLTLNAATLGAENIAIGTSALTGALGTKNVALGSNALSGLTSGDSNLALGSMAGVYYNTSSIMRTSNNSIFIGENASAKADGSTNEIVIGYNAIGRGNNSVQIGNANMTNIGGQVGWSVTSDGRLKKDIQDSRFGLNFIDKLRPVTYKMKTGTTDLQSGFIAQEVETAANSINYEFNGIVKPQTDADFYSLRYAEFVVPLVKAVQEQQKIIEAKDARIAEIEARLLSLEQKIK